MVGNGSIPAPKWDRPLVQIIGNNRRQAQTVRPPPKPIQNPFLLFKQLDIVLLLLFNAVTYSVYYAITTTIAQIFGDRYPFLSESEIGLLFLAIGGGSTIGSIGVGKTLDWEYKHIRRRLEKRARADAEKKDSKALLKEEDFPIEEARLRSMPIYLGLFSLCCVGYGWALDQTAPLAVPLILQVISTHVQNPLRCTTTHGRRSGISHNGCHEHNANINHGPVSLPRLINHCLCETIVFLSVCLRQLIVIIE